ncbi:MAG TPA: TonB family protein [Candidatus Acidoferrum sp.]|nr:TonB family protein [Candidatus Acidoferrum sp.]
MKSYTQSLCVLSLFYLTACVLSGPVPASQEPGQNLDDLAKRISKQISKAGISSVVVADFFGQDGSSSIQGRYLADEFSQRLERHKKGFVLIERQQLSSALSNAQLSANDLAAVDSLQRIGSSIQAEAVVTGTLGTTPAQYSLRLTVRRVKDGGVVVSIDESIKRPAYVDSMVLMDPGGPGPEIARAGVDGIGIPTCIYCPPPLYTDKARAEKVQGDVALLVVINQQGRADRIVVTKANDDGLAKRAIESVREWKFKPATDKEGKAVVVIVPIEVTFRLH